MPLIAQLGKNFNPSLSYTIKGSDLLTMALDRVLEAERIIGGKTVYIECNNQSKLYSFYAKANFIKFNERLKQNSKSEDDLLIQMLKYF